MANRYTKRYSISPIIREMQIESINKIKRHTELEKIFINYILDKKLIPKAHKELIQLNTKQN